jgi:hypothetical protein
LSLEVSAGEALARTLHRKAELMEHSRDVLRVVAHPEALLDPFADKRPGPHPGLKPGRFRAGFDNA